MRQVLKQRPSPSLVIALLALIVALGGSAVAGIATKSGLGKRGRIVVKRIARKQANLRITKRAPGLSVKSAQSATDAATVGGLKVQAVDYSATGSTPVKTILSLGGLELKASCDGAVNMDLNASTTKNGARAYVEGIETSSANDTDGQQDVGSGDDPAFNVGDSLDVDGQAGDGFGNQDNALLQYFAPGGAVVTVDLVMDEDGATCEVHGIATGG